MTDRCHESALGVHDEGSRRDGRCTWCGRKYKAAAPRPRLHSVSAMASAYRYTYDPDWGIHRHDA